LTVPHRVLKLCYIGFYSFSVFFFFFFFCKNLCWFNSSKNICDVTKLKNKNNYFISLFSFLVIDIYFHNLIVILHTKHALNTVILKSNVIYSHKHSIKLTGWGLILLGSVIDIYIYINVVTFRLIYRGFTLALYDLNFCLFKAWLRIFGRSQMTLSVIDLAITYQIRRATRVLFPDVAMECKGILVT
jgi:hypothetical protein